MTGLPKSGEGAVHASARVGGRDAEDIGDLGVAQSGVELQGDELALTRVQVANAARTVARRSAASASPSGAASRRRARPRAPCCACAGATRRAPRCGRCRRATPAGSRGADRTSAACQGALEGGGRDLLGGRAIAQQRGGVGVHGVRTGAVERLEGGGDGRGRLVDGHRQRVLHIGATAPSPIRHKHRNPRGAEGIVRV